MFFLLRPTVVGNEQVNFGSGSASQLNRVRRMNRTILTNSGVSFGGIEVKWGDRELRSGKDGPIPVSQYSVPQR